MSVSHDTSKDLSFRQLAASSKKEYPWVTTSKLFAFYAKFRKSVDGIITSDTDTLAKVQAGIRATWAQERNIVGIDACTQFDFGP